MGCPEAPPESLNFTDSTDRWTAVGFRTTACSHLPSVEITQDLIGDEPAYSWSCDTAVSHHR